MNDGFLVVVLGAVWVISSLLTGYVLKNIFHLSDSLAAMGGVMLGLFFTFIVIILIDDIGKK